MDARDIIPSTVVPIDHQIAAVNRRLGEIEVSDPAGRRDRLGDIAALKSALETLRWVKAFGLPAPTPEPEGKT